MTQALIRLARTLMWLSLAVTVAKLTTDTGGGEYLFTLIGIVLVSTAAPYWLSTRLVPHVPSRWGLALGAAVCLFGLMDVTLRTIGFFFPTDSIDARMAFWLPISSLATIPFLALVAHTFLTAFAPAERMGNGAEPAPTDEEAEGRRTGIGA